MELASMNVAIVGAALAVAVGCAPNPATGRRELSLVSESQEIAMGQQAAAEVRQSMGLVPDSALQQYVRAIGLRLAKASERPNLPGPSTSSTIRPSTPSRCRADRSSSPAAF